MKKFQNWSLRQLIFWAPRIYRGKPLRITNVDVVRKMFDRADLAYKDLEVTANGYVRVLIPKSAAPHFPENLSFVDRDRFENFVQNSVSFPGYHQMTFTILAHSPEELYRINVLGLVPPPVTDHWALVPKEKYA